MKLVHDHNVDIEYKIVSDMDIRPETCIGCKTTVLIRRSYKFIDHQDLGSPSIKRILRHEMVLWECKNCGKQFTIKNPNLLFDTNYTSDVKKYVLNRVLEMGDSMKRVVTDLAVLHNVAIDVSTIHRWIDAKAAREATDNRIAEEQLVIEHSGALSLDATFKVVRRKKSEPIQI
jgi:hypothetical protein